MKSNLRYLASFFVSIVFFASCTKEEVMPVTIPSLTTTKTLTVNFSAATKFALFSFKDSAVIANTDSATGKWDFGLRFTKFIVNSQSSGPGSAGVQMQDGIFSSIASAPTTGYAYDTTATKTAIKDGSWYDYNPTSHAFIPKAGKVFLFKTADGAHYAKMQLLSVDYASFAGPVPVTLLYKFQYTYQPSGSINF
jgi:hypothetical protein